MATLTDITAQLGAQIGALLRPFADPTQRLYGPHLLVAAALAMALVWIAARATGETSPRAVLKRASEGLRRASRHPSARMDVRLWLAKRVLRLLGVIALPWSVLAVAGFTLGSLTAAFGAPLDVDVAPVLVTLLFSLTLFITWDFSRFFVHYLAHRIPALWALHKVHHSAQVLTPMTLYRGHPIEALLFNLRGIAVTGALTGLFFWAFGGRAVAWQILGVDALGFTLNLLGANLRHSGVWLSYGPRVERWLVSPSMHQLHHTKEHRHKNMGVWLSIWDRIAGTWLPAGERRELEFGLPAFELNHRPDSVLSALVDPLGLRPRTAGLVALIVLIVAASALVATPANAVDGVAPAAVELPKPVSPSVVSRRPAARASRTKKGATRLRRVTVLGRRLRLREQPGSAHEVGPKQLARFEHNDPHRVIAEAPGVYFREEDGYGLRPNIGMRGVSAERSAKIQLMEDGVPVAPAPYAAPAAYYFPMITRMERVEVVKGPGAIRYGPNTVGGAINLMSAQVPRRFGAFADLAGGTTAYGKAHGRLSFSMDDHPFWSDSVGGGQLEALFLRSDGFKKIDGGGDAGFTKVDLGYAFYLASNPRHRIRHEYWSRIAWASETSHETYLGIAPSDFRVDPWRRYQASVDDLMAWQRKSAVVRWRVAAPSWDVATTLYVAQLDRVWDKVNGFRSGRSVSEVLSNPDAGSNALFYGILTGERAPSTTDEQLLFGRNDRKFGNVGLQVQAGARGELFGVKHDVAGGVRLHLDEVARRHTEAPAVLTGGHIQTIGTQSTLLDANTSALAIASWVQDRVTLGDLTLTPGLRHEHVFTAWDDHQDNADDSKGSYDVLIPALGALYKASKPLALLAGVNRGFVPVAPGQQANADPESSWNTEFGARWTAKRLRWDAIGFWSEYGNLKGSCTFSSGCAPGDVGSEFNGGKVRTLGAELSLQTLLRPAVGMRVPLRFSYTFTQSRFLTDFVSPNPQWGRVAKDDELPYIPPHQLTVQAGVGQSRWEVNAAYRYTAAMRDSAGQGDLGLFTDAAHVVDLAARWQASKLIEVYLTCNNILDTSYIVSHRPFGARPGMRRLIVGGVKIHWQAEKSADKAVVPKG